MVMMTNEGLSTYFCLSNVAVAIPPNKSNICQKLYKLKVSGWKGCQ